MTEYLALRHQGPNTVAIIGGPYDDPNRARARCEEADARDDYLVETMTSTRKALELSLSLSGAELVNCTDEFEGEP